MPTSFFPNESCLPNIFPADTLFVPLFSGNKCVAHLLLCSALKLQGGPGTANRMVCTYVRTARRDSILCNLCYLGDRTSTPEEVCKGHNGTAALRRRMRCFQRSRRNGRKTGLCWTQYCIRLRGRARLRTLRQNTGKQIL